MRRRFVVSLAFLLFLIQGGRLWAAPHGGTVIGEGTAASCQTQDAANAFTNAVAAGGEVLFDCGPDPVVIEVNTNIAHLPVTVNGGGRITLSGENLRQLFYVTGGHLTLNDIALVDGNAAQGGAIYIDQGAAATLRHTFVTSNEASAEGGGIYNRGTLLLESTMMGSNIAGLHGGGIFNNGGTVTLLDSYLISNQTPAGSGGAVYTVNGQLTMNRTAVRSSVTSNQGAVFAAGATEIVNSTFSNNRALEGGALFAVANVTILNATFYENLAEHGGAIWREISSTTTLRNSIVAGSRTMDGATTSLNCDGPTLTSLGRNIIGDATCVASPSVVGDLHNTDPQLGVWFGSPLRGHVPAATSPAVDYALGCPATDQRGYPRPIGAGCDVGSIERGSVVFLPAFVGGG